MGTARTPSQMQKNDTSGPRRHSSITRRSPAAPNLRSRIASATARFGRCAIVGDDDALARGEAVGLQHDRLAELAAAARRASASSSDSHVRKRAVGTPCRAMNAFANALLDSSRAAAAVGPKIRRPSAREAVGNAEAERQFRADDGEIDPLAGGERGRSASMSPTVERHCAREARDSGVAGRGEDVARPGRRRRAGRRARARARRCR